MTSTTLMPIQMLHIYPKSRPGVLCEDLNLGKKSFSEEPLNNKNSGPESPRDSRTPDLTLTPPFCFSGAVRGPHTGSKPPESLPLTSLPAGALSVALESSPVSRLLVLLSWPASSQAEQPQGRGAAGICSCT